MESISIIVPVYNAEKTIRRCIDSLCNQHGGNLIDMQVVAVDDGSTDSTKDILENLKKNYSNLIVLHKENGGPAAARKFGIDNSDSDYLGFCDADDYVDSDMYFTLYDYLKKYNADFTLCGAYLGNNQDVKIEEKPYEIWQWTQEDAYRLFLEHIHLNGSFCTNLFKRDLFEGLEWNFDITYFEDDFLVWQMLAKINKVVKVLVPKYHYIEVSTSLTRTTYGYNRYYGTRVLSERIISDCRRPKLKKYYRKAESLRYLWMTMNLHAYVCSSWSNRQAEQYMLNILRKGWASQVRHLPTSKMKVIATALAISPSITRRIMDLYKSFK